MANPTEASPARDADAPSARPPHPLGVYLERRSLVMLALGFSSGLPYLLVFNTLSAWLRESGLSLQSISTFFLVTLVFTAKFVWAPVIDRVSPPILSRFLGRRRAWMITAQVAVALGLFAISRSDPAHNLGGLALIALWTAFFSATQDIVIDAWRIDSATVERQGALAASYQWGYRIAIIVGGALPLVLADQRGWPFAYATMTVLMLIGVAAVLLAPIPPERAGAAPPANGFLGHLRQAFVDPFADFFRRFAWAGLLILAMICFYRLSDFTLVLMNPFYRDLGFTKSEIAAVTKVFGLIATILGVGAGGAAIAKFGLFRPLAFGAVFAPLSHLSFAWLAHHGPDIRGLTFCIGLDNFAEGFAGTCLIAYMSSLTSAGFTATQYALFSSLYALPGKLLGSQSGKIIEGVAHSAAPGGSMERWSAMFAHLPAKSFTAPAAKLGVPPEALATGYGAFFVYASMMGVVGITLTFIVARRRLGARDDAPAPALDAVTPGVRAEPDGSTTEAARP